MSLSLAQPYWLLGLLLIPLLWLLYGRPGQRTSLLFSKISLFGHLAKPIKRLSGHPTSAALLSLTLISILIALARPQSIQRWQEAKSTGIEIIIALDISDSMAAQDFLNSQGEATSRLQRAKTITADFIRSRAGDRIGLIAFSGRPLLLNASSTNREHLLQHSLPSANIQLNQLEEGTAIGRAIASATLHLTSSLDPQQTIPLTPANPSNQNNQSIALQNTPSTPPRGSPGSKIIVLVTDGANNTGELPPRSAAQVAARLGIRIYTIAVGSPSNQLTAVSDQQDNIPRQLENYDEATLRQISQLTGGAFYSANNSNRLNEAFEDIDQLEKAPTQSFTLIRRQDHHQPFLIAALILLSSLLIWRPLRDARLPE